MSTYTKMKNEKFIKVFQMENKPKTNFEHISFRKDNGQAETEKGHIDHGEEEGPECLLCGCSLSVQRC